MSLKLKVMICVSCVKMDYGVEEGTIPREFIEFDFAEDALDFEVSINTNLIIIQTFHIRHYLIDKKSLIY